MVEFHDVSHLCLFRPAHNDGHHRYTNLGALCGGLLERISCDYDFLYRLERRRRAWIEFIPRLMKLTVSDISEVASCD